MLWKILVTLALGALSGWIASKIMHTKGTLGSNILLGVVGSVIGGFIAGLLNIYASSWVGSVLISVLGACLCIFLARKFSK